MQCPSNCLALPRPLTLPITTICLQPSSACLPVQTLAYSSELPLPMPVQCDDIEDGARVGVIAIQRGQVTMVRAVLNPVKFLA